MEAGSPASAGEPVLRDRSICQPLEGTVHAVFHMALHDVRRLVELAVQQGIQKLDMFPLGTVKAGEVVGVKLDPGVLVPQLVHGVCEEFIAAAVCQVHMKIGIQLGTMHDDFYIRRLEYEGHPIYMHIALAYANDWDKARVEAILNSLYTYY